MFYNLEARLSLLFTYISSMLLHVTELVMKTMLDNNTDMISQGS